MVWTAPTTFLANTALTAAQLNTFIRDNFNETPTGKATAAGHWFVSDGYNSVKERPIESHAGGNVQTFGSEFRDHADSGDLTSVTLVTGAQALIVISAHCAVPSGQTPIYIGCAVTGVTTIAASKDKALRSNGNQGGTHSSNTRTSYAFWLTGLNPGTNTFKLVYATDSDSEVAQALTPRLIVMAL